jgi:hypothetical protein
MIKPNPFTELKNLTRPVLRVLVVEVILCLPQEKERKKFAGDRKRNEDQKIRKQN